MPLVEFTEGDSHSVFVLNRLIIGITISFFLLVVFNEAWIVSTLCYAPVFSFYMYKTGNDLLNTEGQELAIRCIFCIMIYAIIAYRIEILTK